MNTPDKIEKYVETICGQIRWKKARERVTLEMTHHIEDGRDFYIAQGLDEDAATDQSITDTGEAELLGVNFDRVHRPKPQWGMLGAVAVFLTLGIVVGLLLDDGGDIQRRVIFAIIGFAVMLGAYFADFTLLDKIAHRRLFWPIVIVVLVLVFVTRVFYTDNMHAIILAFPLIVAVDVFGKRGKGIKGVTFSWVNMAVIFILVIENMWIIHFFVIGTIILLTAIWKNWLNANKILATIHVLIPFAGVVTFFMLRVMPMRIAAAINPALDPLGFGFMAAQVRHVLGGAVLFGQGAVDTSRLPDATYNFVLTSIISRYGWVMFAAIVSALLVFIVTGFRRCFKQKNGLGFFVSYAVMVTFTFQVITYVLFNLGLTITLISLPLISPGNFATVINMGLIGFMLSVFRTGDVVAHEMPKEIA
jgi:cell division protein FtsW (lipid II flippase)